MITRGWQIDNTRKTVKIGGVLQFRKMCPIITCNRHFDSGLPMDNQTNNQIETSGEYLPPAKISERLESALKASKSPATIRAYKTAWKAWTDWAGNRGEFWLPVTAFPADPNHVAEYLAARVDQGAGMATLRMACSSIGEAHRLNGRSNPCDSAIVKTAMQGFQRQAADKGIKTKQAKGLTSEAVATIRGNLNGLVEIKLKAALTMAIVSIASEAGLRISEMAALCWESITEDETDSSGGGLISINRSKTDQDGEGAVVAITAAAMQDLERLAGLRGNRDPKASIFGLSDRQISRRISGAAKAAGLGDGFSGHSGRVGMAQRMTRNQAPIAAVMRQGRWTTTRMVGRYTRNESAGEARRYL